ncbi:unnamed protein product [Adineta steineri]|uniref:F-box domain-containing protein n=1 Tax=Adineta steineri TaxID=433720 RepID=A0A815L4B5_9BILA|nr:unnamed protein product [Adineta steineri]CAF3638767.1 unnamed protein product [Adineta steineri]
MKYSCVQLNDLPDEILLIIFKQLDNLELLYSFHDVNERLNKILRDPVFTSHLSFVKWSLNEIINKFSSYIILDRFCLQILPKIHMKIKCLDLESESMKNILDAADYPNLYSLGLYNIEENMAEYLFTDERLSSSIFKNQITRLIIGIAPDEIRCSTMEYICNLILTVFINLNELIFYDASYQYHIRLMNYTLCPNFSSSSLSILKIKVQTFSVCLYLLDGHFNQLHTLYIELANTFLSPEEVEHQNQMDLPSKEDIQQTFNRFQNTKIISCVDYFLEPYKYGRCHIYTYPSSTNYYEYISNNFPGGLYPYVSVISLYDEQPFEHDFFIRIAQSFPFMEKLSIFNRYEQNQKDSYKLMGAKSNLSIVKYNYLVELHLDPSHDCYIEEFLCDTKTYFQNNITLLTHYEALQRVTYDFIRDDTRINCTKISELVLLDTEQYSKSCKDYFPFAIIE